LVRPRPGSSTVAAFGAALGPVARSRLTVHEELGGALQMLRQPVDDGAEMERRLSHPAGQRGAIQVDAGSGEDLRLPVEMR